ncbi:hypothetical protein LTR85_002811 [Meristemomyces frigidus]|nr:hypothetical protein LTR85_002811 [Meristemomyces frigidus]
MSHRPADQGPPEGSTGDNSQPRRLPSLNAQNSQYAPRPSGSTSVAPSPIVQRLPQPLGYGYELPPLPQAPGSAGGTFSPATTRLAGVSSILNPAQDELEPSRRRKASEISSPRMSAPSLPPLAMGNRPSQAPPTHAGASTVTSFGGPAERPAQRRILTPRSPALHHSASLGQLGPSAGTISAHQNPFPASPRDRAYAVEPGTSGAPPLPTPPAAMRPMYGFPGPTPSSDVARRASFGANRGGRAASGSVSPSTSYSSYSQTSPGDQYGGIPISSSSGQNVYQMMTLETTSGTMQLPVDVQAASRVADEKRRRNAGASARFRQRRKEKEKEASTMISRLEQQVKDATDAMDFYRRERDFMATLLRKVPGGDRHFPRPQSPRRRRSSSVLGGRTGSMGAGCSSAQESAPRSPEHGRNVRRRTSTLSLSQHQAAQTTLLPQGAPFQQGYGPQSYSTPIAPQPHPPLQPAIGPMQSPLSRGVFPPAAVLPQLQPPPAPAPPQLMQAPPQTGPWNPYALDRRPLGPPGPPRDPR